MMYPFYNTTYDIKDSLYSIFATMQDDSGIQTNFYNQTNDITGFNNITTFNEAISLYDDTSWSNINDYSSTNSNLNQSNILASLFQNDDTRSDDNELSQSKKSLYKKVIFDLIKNPDLAKMLFTLDSGTPNTTLNSWDKEEAPNTSKTLEDFKDLFRPREDAGRTVLILMFYSIIICVSLFGNFLVCHVVLRTRTLRTVTNSFLANLAVSDLFMTVLNIPFNVARILMDEWIFGSMMCKFVPYIQVVSVYVSAFTMVAIALDRYRVIVHPLKPRLTKVEGALIIAIIWFLACIAAIPHALYNEVAEIITFKRVQRCQARYPNPSMLFRKWLTLGTFITQYALPLFITMVAYLCVSRKVWWRSVLGAATKYQVYLHIKAKRKTVKMLLVVVFVFAMCWLPLNTYHLVVDFDLDKGPKRHSSTIFFICHWFAMSSVCYNPFIYSWLNDHFKAGAKDWLSCFAKKVFRINTKQECSDGDMREQNTSSFFKLRDSTTGSSSTYGGTIGCTIRSGGSRSDSMRSKSSHSQIHSLAASDIHVPLDELISSPTKPLDKNQCTSNKHLKKKLTYRASNSSVSSCSSGNKPLVSSFITNEIIDPYYSVTPNIPDNIHKKNTMIHAKEYGCSCIKIQLIENPLDIPLSMHMSISENDEKRFMPNINENKCKICIRNTPQVYKNEYTIQPTLMGEQKSTKPNYSSSSGNPKKSHKFPIKKKKIFPALNYKRSGGTSKLSTLKRSSSVPSLNNYKIQTEVQRNAFQQFYISSCHSQKDLPSQIHNVNTGKQEHTKQICQFHPQIHIRKPKHAQDKSQLDFTSKFVQSNYHHPNVYNNSLCKSKSLNDVFKKYSSYQFQTVFKSSSNLT